MRAVQTTSVRVRCDPHPVRPLCVCVRGRSSVPRPFRRFYLRSASPSSSSSSSLTTFFCSFAVRKIRPRFHGFVSSNIRRRMTEMVDSGSGARVRRLTAGVAWLVLALTLLLSAHVAASAGVVGQHYTNQWAVRIDGSQADARRLAQRHGFIYVDKVRTCTSCGLPLGRITHLARPSVRLSVRLFRTEQTKRRKEVNELCFPAAEVTCFQFTRSKVEVTGRQQSQDNGAYSVWWITRRPQSDLTTVRANSPSDDRIYVGTRLRRRSLFNLSLVWFISL